MSISKNSIEDLKKSSKISDFVLSTTTGKLRGLKGMALCPFHGEKTASMSFTDIENLFHCFGCKEGGDIFHYVQLINNFEFQEAVEFVAEKYNFKLSYLSNQNEINTNSYIEKMKHLNEYFLRKIQSEQGAQSKSYLNSRGYGESEVIKYGIGYIDSDLTSLNKYMKIKNISEQDLSKLGFKSSNNNFLFKNRILFPILNFKNEVIAFGGRSLDDFGPKYLNSSDSILYKKNKSLFFTQKFLKSVKDKKYVFIVEGYFDVLALNQLGYSNVVSASGTAFTINQLNSLTRYSKKFLLCFDNDDAGLKATEKFLELKTQVSTQIEIHCLNLPKSYKDISDFYEAKKGNFSALIKENKNIVEFLLDNKMKNESDKVSIFNYFRLLSQSLSPLEVDVALDYLSLKLNTQKDILKNEISFNPSSEANVINGNKTLAIETFKEIIFSEILKQKDNISDELKELTLINESFSIEVDSIKISKEYKKKLDNVSYSEDQLKESIARLYLYFSELKIRDLIQDFENSSEKDFKIIQKIEDIKKKKEYYLNTI
jgi:DNA primase